MAFEHLAFKAIVGRVAVDDILIGGTEDVLLLLFVTLIAAVGGGRHAAIQTAARQFQAGDITQAQRDAFSSKMAYGSGWPFHHHHIHLSMKWWGTAKPGAEPLEGCGFDLVRHRVRDKGVLPSLR